jgi:hypothetical protein
MADVTVADGPPVGLQFGWHAIRPHPASEAVRSISYCRSAGEVASVQVGSSRHSRSSSVGIHHRLELTGEAGEVTVVDAAVVDLDGKVMKQPNPVPPVWLKWDVDRHESLDDVDRESVARCGSLLFPGSVPARG